MRTNEEYLARATKAYFARGRRKEPEVSYPMPNSIMSEVDDEHGCVILRNGVGKNGVLAKFEIDPTTYQLRWVQATKQDEIPEALSAPITVESNAA
jgi:hypothetical protein